VAGPYDLSCAMTDGLLHATGQHGHGDFRPTLSEHQNHQSLPSRILDELNLKTNADLARYVAEHHLLE
jgi:hypothetical protein